MNIIAYGNMFIRFYVLVFKSEKERSLFVISLKNQFNDKFKQWQAARKETTTFSETDEKSGFCQKMAF